MTPLKAVCDPMNRIRIEAVAVQLGGGLRNSERKLMGCLANECYFPNNKKRNLIFTKASEKQDASFIIILRIGCYKNQPLHEFSRS